MNAVEEKQMARPLATAREAIENARSILEHTSYLLLKYEGVANGATSTFDPIKLGVFDSHKLPEHTDTN